MLKDAVPVFAGLTVILELKNIYDISDTSVEERVKMLKQNIG